MESNNFWALTVIKRKIRAKPDLECEDKSLICRLCAEQSGALVLKRFKRDLFLVEICGSAGVVKRAGLKIQ